MDADALVIVVCHSSDHERWLSERRKIVTASDAAAILGVGYQSALTAYMRKLGLEPELAQSEAMQRGTDAEPMIMAGYARATGRDVRRDGRLCIHDTMPWLGATFDARTRLDGDADWMPLELKWTRRSQDWDHGVPERIMPQLQVQMLVWGCSRASVAVEFALGGSRWIDVGMDYDMCRQIILYGEDFMRRLRDEDPPPPDGSSSASKSLSMRASTEDTASLTSDHVLMDMRIAEIDEMVKELRLEGVGLKNTIKHALGGAECGILPGGGKWKWATSKSGVRSFRRTR